MNMIDIQDKLKSLSEQQLVSEMQSPSGAAPQFLVLSEITRRKRMRDSFQNQQAQPTTSIAEEAIASAGVPGGGIASMARSMAPNSSIAQNTAAMPSQPMPQEQPVQGMYGGGPVRKMQDGGYFSRSPDEDDWFLDMLNPLVGAEQSVRDYQEGDYPGAVLNAASAFPFTKGIGLAGKGALTVAPEVYEYLYPEKEGRRPLRPNTMSGGGYVKKMAGGMSVGGQSADMSNPMVAAWVRAEAQRRGVPVEQVLASLGPTGNALVQQSQVKADRNRMLGLEPSAPALDQGFSFPTQGDLSRRFAEDQVSINSRPMMPQPIDSLPEIFPPAPREGRVIGSQPPAFPSPMAPQMEPPVDLDLTAPTMSSPVAPRQQDMRLMGLEPQGGSSPRVDEILDQRQYGFEPGSDRRMTAVEMLSQSAGQSAPLPTQPEGSDMLPSGKTLDEYSRLGMYGNDLPAQYEDGTIFDPITGVPISGGGVEGETPDPNSTGNWWEDLTMSDAAKRQLNETRAKVDAVKASTPAPGANATTTDTTTTTSGAGAGSDTGTSGASSAQTPQSSASATGRGAGAAVGGSNAPTSYEQELRDAMARAEKRANQDKWLALAQVGMQLMSSKEPTLGGALGEAGIAGLQAYRGSRDAYENERLGLTKSLYDLQQQQAAAAAAQRAAAAKALGKPLTPDQRLKQIEDRLKFLVQGDPITGETIMPGADGAVAALRQEYVNLINGTGGSTFDATTQ